MKVELHLHTSAYSGCATNTPDEMMRRLIKCGYEAVYITEHDAVWNDRQLERVRANFPKLKIFPGVEVTLTDFQSVQHLIVLGTNDPDYLQIADEATILGKAADEGHLTILAHPFRWPGGAFMLGKGLRPDALECHTPNHGPQAAQMASTVNNSLGIALVNASDAHSTEMIDQFWIETDSPLEQADDIHQIILKGAYKNCSREG